MNHHHPAFVRDLTQFSPEQFEETLGIIPEIDMIVGGPPCQGFSMAGKRDKNDPRNSLFMEFYKYISYFRPKVFVMENVIGILSMKTNLLTDNKRNADIDIIYSNISISMQCRMYGSNDHICQSP